MFRARKSSRTREPVSKMLLVFTLKKARRRDRTFRFLDLPAEMRNIVYTELLTFRPKAERICWPAILTTCRQVRDEAQDLIYAVNTFDLTLAVKSTSYMMGDVQVISNGQKRCIDEDWGLLKGLLGWPKFLENARALRLHINIDARRGWNDEAFLHETDVLQVTHMLYDMQYFLQRRGKLKDLKVNLTFNMTVSGELVEDLLRPARFMHAPKWAAEVNFKGEKYEVHQGVLSDKTDPRGVLATLRKCYELYHEANLVLRLLQLVPPSEYALSSLLRTQQSTLEQELDEFIFQAPGEHRSLEETLRELDLTLRGIDIKEIESRIQHSVELKEEFEAERGKRIGQL